MLEVFKDLFMFLSLLNVFAVIFILFRPDRKMIWKDFKKMFVVKSLAYITISIISAFFFLLPFSIPFSIMTIMEGDDNKY